jgi:hypothetical protein
MADRIAIVPLYHKAVKQTILNQLRLPLFPSEEQMTICWGFPALPDRPTLLRSGRYFFGRPCPASPAPRSSDAERRAQAWACGTMETHYEAFPSG